MTDTKLKHALMRILCGTVINLQAKSINGLFLASWIDVLANGSRLDLMSFASIAGGWASIRHQRNRVHITVNRGESGERKCVFAPLNKQVLQHKTCLRRIIWGWSMHRVLKLLHLILARVENKSRSQLLERSGATYSFISFFLYGKFL